MKCPRCHKDMIRKNGGKSIYYYECPRCGRSINKPSTEENTTSK